MTNNAGIFDIIGNKSEDILSNKTTASLINEQKDSPSLFDSMLLNVGNIEELQSKDANKSVNVEEIIKDTKVPSLLDQMMKEIQEQLNQEDILKEKEKPFLDSLKVSSTLNIILEDENKDLNQIMINSKNDTIGAKIANNSLLDRLINEVNAQIKKEYVDEQNIIVVKDNVVRDNMTKEIFPNNSIKPTTFVQTQNLDVKATQSTLEEFNILNNKDLKLNVDISKDELLNIKKSTQTSEKSLLDRLLEDGKKTSVEPLNIKNEQPNNLKNDQKDQVINSILQSSQIKISKDISLEKASDAKNILSNGNSIKEIKKSADILSLNLTSSELFEELSEEGFARKNEFLNKLSLFKEFVRYDFNENSVRLTENGQSLKKSNANKIEAPISIADKMKFFNSLPEVELSVSSTVAYNIENRIIGAKQQMNQMMSDAARVMYENYKPPITAFRLSLNPVNLGNIAILMRNSKSDGLSISLNMTNQSTLDSFIDNQTILKEALAKKFNIDTNINLEFNMQSGEQQSNDKGRQEGEREKRIIYTPTNDILESLDSQNDLEIEDTSYM